MLFLILLDATVDGIMVAAMDAMLRGEKIADLITAGAALDFVIPDIDR